MIVFHIWSGGAQLLSHWMPLTCLLTQEILSTLCLTYASCGTVTADLIPDVAAAHVSPKLVGLQEAPVSVLNWILKQTLALSINQTRFVLEDLSST